MDVSLPNLSKNIHAALKTWRDADPPPSLFEDMLLFQQARRQYQGNTRQALNVLLSAALDALAAAYPLEADLLRLRFLDDLTVYTIANQRNVADSTIHRQQTEALNQLALTLQAQENTARRDYQLHLEQWLNLPPLADLVGITGHLACLADALTQPGPPWLVSIEGLGGLGKTALANLLIRQPALAGRYDHIAWVSAKQQEFLPGRGLTDVGAPALTLEALVNALLGQIAPDMSLAIPLVQKQAVLTDLLKRAPGLVVIDNLETVTDYLTLLPLLRRLTNPSRFLLTSRHSLRAEPDVFCRSLTELSQADTLNLLRYEARMRGLTDLTDAPDEPLVSIYQVVGGNPLALKLVVGQLAVISLPDVLTNLKVARGQSIDDLYTYIYWQAWQLLNPAARQVFLVMPLAQGGPRAQLLHLTGLDEAALDRALLRLTALSLVQVSGGLDERRYTLHRLTETFLLNEAARWTPLT